MGSTTLVRTVVPIILLVGTGFISRKIGILRAGDERVLNAYVYFFALPSLFFIDLAETSFAVGTLRFIGAGIIRGASDLCCYLLHLEVSSEHSLFAHFQHCLWQPRILWHTVHYVRFSLERG